MEKLAHLIQEYIGFAEGLRTETASVMSVLGFRDREIYHPEHTNFYENVKKWTEDFLQQSPSQQQRMQALDILLFAAAGREKSAAYWYLMAVQKHGAELINGLEPENKLALREKFCSAYPTNIQTGVQKELRKLMGPEPKKKWGFFF